ncbi:NADPH-dependent FMN reductase [Marivivens niveibacter]|uniref:NADPH-dependent FMN reductase n=1 Tax=Marivivens niveibacter TaxID=1930667 RepID=A0A251WZC9_9RHOB|nr:NAD(P)H-dependent oxidoreductase [Marivivens niveibacter]OUD09488.1 NADPH-dependent FMN reductase [Marivivens niveibacter]
MTKLLGICGSLRDGSYNLMLLKQAAERFGADQFNIAEIRMELYDGDVEERDGIPAAAQALYDQIKASDAVIIATPEYNKSIPGGLKNALDWVSRIEGNPWENKPVSIISAAAGRGGGDRSQYALRHALQPFAPLLLNGREVLVGGAFNAFGDDGKLADDQAVKMLDTHLGALKDLITYSQSA